MAGLAITAVGVSAASPSDDHRGSGRTGVAFDHLYVSMLGCHSRSSVLDDPNAPFITSVAHQRGMADMHGGVHSACRPSRDAVQTGGRESADGCCDSPYVPATDPRTSPC